MSEFNPANQAKLDANPEVNRYHEWVGKPGEINPETAYDFNKYFEERPSLNKSSLVRDVQTPVQIEPEDHKAQNITGSFERPVVIRSRQKRHKRAGMIIDDIQDNLEHVKPPYTAYHEGLEADELRERLLPDEAVKAVRRIGEHYPDGFRKRIVDHVGTKGAGDFHPHYYFIDRTSKKTRMFFVDPEHRVASNVFIRPSIVNLVGVEVSDDESESPQVAILRYKVPKYDTKNKPKGLGPAELLNVIEEVLDTEGELPEVLSGELEQQILFILTSSNTRSRVQARYSSKKQIEDFARGKKGSSALEGKVKVQADVLNKFFRLFNKPYNARTIGEVALTK